MPDNRSSLVREVGQTDGVTVVALRGDLDLHHAPELREALDALTEKRPRRVVLDLKDVRYMDSTGLGTLVYFLKELGGFGGKLGLTNPNATVRNVLEITRLAKVFSTYGSVDEAVKALGAGGNQR